MEDQEYLDIFDDNMKHIGIASRDEVHEKGYWHQTFHCWLIRRENENHYVLFQRRGTQKELYPDKLDITAAGHLTSGETPEEGIRELKEELGLPVAFEDLISLGIRCEVAIIGRITNREFCHVYLLASNFPLDAYTLQPEELSGLVQMELYDGMKLFSGEVEEVPVSGFRIDEKGAKCKIESTVSKVDIIPRLDGYYMKVFIMAERYFQGNPYLSI
jgi:isopentenyldiphosphate isomerase